MLKIILAIISVSLSIVSVVISSLAFVKSDKATKHTIEWIEKRNHKNEEKLSQK